AWERCAATEPSASRWCAAGALCKVSGVRRGAPGFAFLEAASVRLFGIGIGRANDDTRLGHAGILRCYDLAIALAGETTARRASRASPSPTLSRPRTSSGAGLVETGRGKV